MKGLGRQADERGWHPVPRYYKTSQGVPAGNEMGRCVHSLLTPHAIRQQRRGEERGVSAKDAESVGTIKEENRRVMDIQVNEGIFNKLGSPGGGGRGEAQD